MFLSILDVPIVISLSEFWGLLAPNQPCRVSESWMFLQVVIISIHVVPVWAIRCEILECDRRGCWKKQLQLDTMLKIQMLEQIVTNENQEGAPENENGWVSCWIVQNFGRNDDERSNVYVCIECMEDICRIDQRCSDERKFRKSEFTGL